jgi:hypothetical protein
MTMLTAHRIEATIKMHPIGLRHFHDLVPLPQFEEEDSGLYFFLAQISLRKFLTQTLEVVGYLVGRVVFAPVVTGELRKQVREWYDHLPSIVRFPLDSTPLFDSRKSFLRGQYVALHVVLGWPSVLEILKQGDSGAAHQGQDTQLVIRDQAQDCLRSSALYLSIADEQLMGRKMGTHFTLYALVRSPQSRTALTVTVQNIRDTRDHDRCLQKSVPCVCRRDSAGTTHPQWLRSPATMVASFSHPSWLGESTYSDAASGTCAYLPSTCRRISAIEQYEPGNHVRVRLEISTDQYGYYDVGPCSSYFAHTERSQRRLDCERNQSASNTTLWKARSITFMET